jgi:two-component system, chemotaxis family, protein-glutamate methylesterase/glutaminase
VALGGSAGALPALLAILARLPAEFAIPVVVVHHLAAGRESRLPKVLGYGTALRCTWAADGEEPRAGAIHVAPPGAALTLAADGRFRVTPGAKPRLGGPSVDMFLESAAETLGRRTIAVVLSGALTDGTKGIQAVRRAGGRPWSSASRRRSIGACRPPRSTSAAPTSG